MNASIPKALTSIKYIVAIASGKGGVGKSTLTVNLAASFHQNGWKVGLLDADIHDPNQQILLGITEKKPDINNGLFIPPIIYGIKVLSMGLLVQSNIALAWRSHMIINAFRQLIEKTQWGKLDILLIDLPPGTGDINLTLAKTVQLNGVIIVSTPQDLSLAGIIRCIHLFKIMHIPILGLIENMSTFLCPHCHQQSNIFSQNSIKKLAKEKSHPFLGTIPLTLDIQESSNQGIPLPIANPANPITKLFDQIAKLLIQNLH